MALRNPLSPFNLETATAKVQAGEDGWNSREPLRVSEAYSENSTWRNRDQFFSGRPAVIKFLSEKWAKELDYKLKKNSGALPITVSPCAFNTNGTTVVTKDTDPTAMNCGNLIVMVTWNAAKRVSMTSLLTPPNASYFSLPL